MGERQVWFDWLGRTCLLDNIRSGKIYIGEEEVDIVHMPATVTGSGNSKGSRRAATARLSALRDIS